MGFHKTVADIKKIQKYFPFQSNILKTTYPWSGGTDFSTVC